MLLGALIAAAVAAGGCASSRKSVHVAAPLPRPAASSEIAPSTAPAPLDPSTIMIERAAAMLGQPYRYGGTEPGGFDCSGLVAYAAAGAGIQLPRTTKDQLHAGVAVRRPDIKPADLVFMRLTHKELHVGIAIDGARFIHAPSAGGIVRIDSLAQAPYSRGFLAARRVAETSRDPAAPAPPPNATP